MVAERGNLSGQVRAGYPSSLQQSLTRLGSRTPSSRLALFASRAVGYGRRCRGGHPDLLTAGRAPGVPTWRRRKLFLIRRDAISDVYAPSSAVPGRQCVEPLLRSSVFVFSRCLLKYTICKYSPITSRFLLPREHPPPSECLRHVRVVHPFLPVLCIRVKSRRHIQSTDHKSSTPSSV